MADPVPSAAMMDVFHAFRAALMQDAQQGRAMLAQLMQQLPPEVTSGANAQPPPSSGAGKEADENRGALDTRDADMADSADEGMDRPDDMDHRASITSVKMDGSNAENGMPVFLQWCIMKRKLRARANWATVRRRVTELAESRFEVMCNDGGPRPMMHLVQHDDDLLEAQRTELWGLVQFSYYNGRLPELDALLEHHFLGAGVTNRAFERRLFGACKTYHQRLIVAELEFRLKHTCPQLHHRPHVMMIAEHFLWCMQQVRELIDDAEFSDWEDGGNGDGDW